MKIRTPLTSLLLLATTAGLAACGDDDDSPSAGSAVTAEAPDATTVPPTDTGETTEPPETTDPPDTTAPPETTDPPDTTEADTTEAPDTTEASDTTSDDTSTPTTSGDGPAMDSEFCRSAAEAESLGDEVDIVQNEGPEAIEAAVRAALEASEATVELAPEEIVDAMNTRVELQRRFTDLLEEHEWDASAALGTPEGRQLLSDSEEVEEEAKEVRAYLELHCGIEDDTDDDDPPTTVAVDLPEGDEGLRRFIQLYARGASVEVTQEQEDCFVDELSGKVEVEQLEAGLAGEESEEVKIAVGVAVLACDIEINATRTTETTDG